MKTYKIKKGDTLTSIANYFKVDLKDLIKLNDISNPNLIYVGNILLIPGEDLQEYLVVKDDTLTSIAQKHATTVKKIVELNNIKNPDLISIDQILYLPIVEKTEKTYYINATKKVNEDYEDIIENLISMGFTVGVI